MKHPIENEAGSPSCPGRRRRPARLLLLGILALLAAPPAAPAADWPAYRHDAQRSAVTEERLVLPLRLAWKYRCAQPPRPAWPDTLLLINRTDFDYAPPPVIADGIVYFGSSADDTVRALDAATGREKWHFITGGPVRFAPQIDNGKVFFGSDDGHVYCLDAQTGKQLWKFQAALRDERLIGNHRMISRWPCRSGVLVDSGVVYSVAGMWSTEGVFVYALRADTGEVIWCNDTTGFSGAALVDPPKPPQGKPQTYSGHAGEFAANGQTGSNPQGALLLGANVLLIPNGNALPTFIERATGALSRAQPSQARAGCGGTWLTIDKGNVYAFAKHHEDRHTIQPFSLTTGKGGKGWGSPNVPQVRIIRPKRGQIHDRGKVSAIVHDGALSARQAYGLALAKGGRNPVLLLGEDGAVSAQDPDTERELWRAPVTGEAREIAIAGGRLYVSTTAGLLYCFERAASKDKAPVVHDPGAAPRSVSPPPPKEPVAAILAALQEAGMDRGFALVLGDPGGELSTALAAYTRLQIVNALTDAVAAANLRERLLEQTIEYGSRIQVSAVTRLDSLPMAQFFANAVIVAGRLPALSGKELYRVLRPCGGILLTPGLDAAETETLRRDSGARQEGIRPGGPAGPSIVRGKLRGALDWDWRRKRLSSVDQRVKWPLRPLWFGGPGTAQIHGLVGGASPVVANGRYFVRGERVLTAVDAYNGALLWSRPIPKQSPQLTEVNGVIYRVAKPPKVTREDMIQRLQANDDYVYLQLGPAYFRGPEDEVLEGLAEGMDLRSTKSARLQLDARTGAQLKVAAPYNPPEPVSLATPQSWRLAVDPRHYGTVALQASDRGLLLTLTTTDPVVAKLDNWELFFDLRPPATRYGLYGRGTFQVRVTLAADANTPASWQAGAGQVHPDLEVTGTREPNGTRTTVVVPWAEIQKLTNRKPKSFGFAAILNSYDGGASVDEPISRAYLFCDWTAEGLNSGWASVAVGKPAGGTSVVDPPPIIVATLRNLTSVVRSSGEVAGAVVETPRLHPLTGEPEPKMFRIATMCGGPYSSAFLRAGSQSIQDFADDSGMRPIGGVKTRCSTPQVAALGLLIVSEENGHCECTFPMRTSLAFAPAERPLHEDWAFFFDRPADTRVRCANINLGGPGDRRDDQGALWLGYPRLPPNKSRTYPKAAGKQRSVGANGVWYRIMSGALQVPMDIECSGGGDAYRPEGDASTYRGWHTTWIPNRSRKEIGPYRVNADRAGIRGTDRPWLYASCYRGIRKVTMTTDILLPVNAPLAQAPPKIDGDLHDDTWQGAPQTTLPFTKTAIHLRHNSDHLYIAARRPPIIGRLGKVSPWAVRTSGEDANVWLDDSFEVFVGSRDTDRVIHLGVSASGARYDALTIGADNKRENRQWNTAWTSAVHASDGGLAFEIAIPWTAVEAAGLKRDRIGINCQMNQKDVSAEPPESPGLPLFPKPLKETGGEAMCYLGIEGRSHCQNFAPLDLGEPRDIEPRLFTVRLHFAELELDAKPGQRVFDVKLQGRTVLRNLDVVKEAGAARTALVKEFKGVKGAGALTAEFVSAAANQSAGAAPILSALEIVDESFIRPSVSAGP